MRWAIRYCASKEFGGSTKIELGWTQWVDHLGYCVNQEANAACYGDINIAYQTINTWPVKARLGYSGLFFLVEEFL